MQFEEDLATSAATKRAQRFVPMATRARSPDCCANRNGARGRAPLPAICLWLFHEQMRTGPAPQSQNARCSRHSLATTFD